MGSQGMRRQRVVSATAVGRWLTALMVGAVVLAACGQDGQREIPIASGSGSSVDAGQDSSPAGPSLTDGSGRAGPGPGGGAEAGGTPGSPADGDVNANVNATVGTGTGGPASAPSSTTTAAPERYQPRSSPDGLRLAPVGGSRPDLVWWSEAGAEVAAGDGEFVPVVEGPLAAVADTGDGFVFQRATPSGRREPTIWFIENGRTAREMVNPVGRERLELIGSTVVDDKPIVVYLSTVTEGAGSVSLWLVDPLTGQRTLLDQVEGSGAGSVDGAVGLRLDDVGSYPDLAVTRVVDGEAEVTVVDGETGLPGDQVWCGGDAMPCPAYDRVVLVGRRLYGFRPLDPADDTAGGDSATSADGDRATGAGYGLFRVEPDGGGETVIAEFDGYGDRWQPVAVAALDAGTIVMSVADAGGAPLPPVVINIDTGKASTVDRAGFVAPRPAAAEDGEG